MKDTIKRAEKTHNIPHDNKKVGESSLRKVKKSLYQFLQGRDGSLQPVFCLALEIEDVEGSLKALLGEAEEVEVFDVFDVGIVLSEIQLRIKDEAEPVSMFSADLANHYLEEDTFLYKTASVDSCSFHQSLDNVKFCSLNIVKRRVWSICEKSTLVLGLTLDVGRHLPNEDTYADPGESQKFGDSDDEEEEEDEFKKAAVVKKGKNPFGTKVPRCGSMGGHTALPARDPTLEFEELRKKSEAEMTKSLMSLTLNTEIAPSESPSCYNQSTSGAPTGTDDFFSSGDEDGAVSAVSAVSVVSAFSGNSRRTRPKIWANFVTKGSNPPSINSRKDFPPL